MRSRFVCQELHFQCDPSLQVVLTIKEICPCLFSDPRRRREEGGEGGRCFCLRLVQIEIDNMRNMNMRMSINYSFTFLQHRSQILKCDYQ